MKTFKQLKRRRLRDGAKIGLQPPMKKDKGMFGING